MTLSMNYKKWMKNVLQLLYIIAHEIFISNLVCEHIHGLWKMHAEF